MGAGFAVSACGFLWLSRVGGDSPLWFTLAGSAVYAGGLVAAMTLANELALGAAPPERAGSAAAVLESGQELGGALGMAILGSIGAAVYRSDMAGAPGAVRETLGGATAVAHGALLTSAHHAFVHGLDFAAVGAAVAMAGAAVLSVVLLRGAGPAGSRTTAPQAGGSPYPRRWAEPSFHGGRVLPSPRP